MLEKLIFIFTAILGFITLFIIGYRFKTNRHINFYLILFFFLSSLRFFIHSVSDILFLQNFQKLIDLISYTTIWPILYLYFRNLVNNHNGIKIEELLHIIIPSFFFLFFFSIKQFVLNDALILVGKIVFMVAIAWNVIYAIASYKLLQEKVWKRNSDILIINQQNKIIKRWTQLLFGLFSLIFFRFLISILLIKNGFWYVAQNNFMWVGALIWIVLYFKILYSPEFLYGYEKFQNKIREYKKHAIVFDHIWIRGATKQVTNIQDTVLKEKIASKIDNYILGIEDQALNTDLFFTKNLQIEDLAHKLNIPKSHLLYIFKYHANISFSDFKKIVRIQKTIVLIDQDYLKSNTLESLALATGFSSYTTFFTSFKSIAGVSPKIYSDKQ